MKPAYISKNPNTHVEQASYLLPDPNSFKSHIEEKFTQQEVLHTTGCDAISAFHLSCKKKKWAWQTWNVLGELAVPLMSRIIPSKGG